MTDAERQAHERIDREIALQRARGESLGDQCPLWLSAMGEADWEAERHLTCGGKTYAEREPKPNPQK